MSLSAHSAVSLTKQRLVLPVHRMVDSHKGSHGSLGVVGGAASMLGAALLSANPKRF